MKRWAVIVEIPVQHDIEAAYLWIAERDSEAADRWFNSIYDRKSWIRLTRKHWRT
jgi:hypothetical protein